MVRPLNRNPAMDIGLLFNSLGVTALAVTVSLSLGIPVAVALRIAPRRLRMVLLGLVLLVLALPPFFVAGMWMQVVGFAGAWRMGEGEWTTRYLPMVMSALVLGGLLWPLPALLLAGAVDRLDPRLLEANPLLSGTPLLRYAVAPVLRRALGPPMALTAALAFGNFAVPSLFQARIWPETVWVEFSTRFDTGAALIRSWPFILLAMGFAVLGLRRPLVWPMRGEPAGAGLLRERFGFRWTLALGVSVVAILVLTLGLPVGLAARQERMWSELVPALLAARPMIIRSVVFAAGAATLVLAGGLWLARTRWGAVAAPLFFLPGIFPGMLLLRAMEVPPLDAVRGSGWIVPGALGVRYLFVGWLVATRLWHGADPGLHATARLLGAGTGWRWRKVVLPGAGRTLAGLWFMIYVLALWDVETLVLIVPPGGDTLALMIFNLLHYGHNPQVSALCFWLGAAAVLPLAGAWVLARIFGRPGVRPRWTAVSAALPAVPMLALMLMLLAGCGGEPTRDIRTTAAPVAEEVRIESRLFGSVRTVGGRGTGPGRFLKPRSLAVDADENLFVVDMTGRVQRFDGEGRWVALWQMPETDNGRAKGMAIAPDGAVLVVEPHYHRVNRFHADGTLLGQWGVHGTNAGQFWFPRAIANGIHGDCLVSEYGVVERVQRFSGDGRECLGAIGRGGTGPGEFNRAEGIGTDAAGRLYVADSCNHRIQVFDPDGRWLRMHGRAGNGPGEFSYPYDVRVDAAGNQFVCEFGNSRVQVLDADDRPVEILGGPGAGPGQMNNPWSLCLDRHGHVYVADSQNHRVLRFKRRSAPMAIAGAMATRTASEP